MTEEIHRDLGRHEAEIMSLQADMRELKSDVKTILNTLSEARGGWKTLMLIGGIAGAAGALITKVIPFLGGMPR